MACAYNIALLLGMKWCIISYLQVPTSISYPRMRMWKSCFKFFPLLWIFTWQISNTSCASIEIQNYSLKSFNLSVIKSNSTAPKNLSDLIEFSPLNLPVELENISVFHHGLDEDVSPKIITMKLKTHVVVQSQKNNSETSFHETNEEIKITKPNASDSSLSEIEYLDTEESGNSDFLKWKSRSRTARMSSFDEKTVVPNNSDEEAENSSEEDISNEKYESKDSEENRISKTVQRSMHATGRQFLFHPYLSHGKDIPPDEKISFHDILPVKTVKFIKEMVEETDWNKMFKDMVSMVVNNFVARIIEKMFSEKHEHQLKRRSLHDVLGPAFDLPIFQMPVVRSKRATGSKNSLDEEDDIMKFLYPKRIPQVLDEEGKKSSEERMSWLDHFLDFVFPNSKSNESDRDSLDRLKKRDTANSQLLKVLVALFLNTFEKSSEFFADAKDVLRYKMLKDFAPYLYQNRYTSTPHNSSANSTDRMKMTHRKFTENIFKRNDIADNTLARSRRSKRSTTGGDFQKDEEDRLWQAHSRRHKPHTYRSRDECSLRKACNAGRLLSRIPSVQDITLQLRSSGNEPHWDALIWGMRKKHCSRIFCKRQRSPKGSKYSWHPDKERLSKKVQIVTEPPEISNETDNLTV